MSLSGSESVAGAGKGKPLAAGEQPGAKNAACSRRDYGELEQLLEAAARHLKDSNLVGARFSLKKASVRATSMWVDSGDPTLPQPLTDLGEFRENLRRLERQWRRTDPRALVELLNEIRAQFDDHAHFGAARGPEAGEALRNHPMHTYGLGHEPPEGTGR